MLMIKDDVINDEASKGAGATPWGNPPPRGDGPVCNGFTTHTTQDQLPSNILCFPMHYNDKYYYSIININEKA